MEGVDKTVKAIQELGMEITEKMNQMQRMQNALLETLSYYFSCPRCNCLVQKDSFRKCPYCATNFRGSRGLGEEEQ
jgi:recombinational DNA repair protein RecR